MSWPLDWHIYFKHNRSDVVMLWFMGGESSGLYYGDRRRFDVPTRRGGPQNVFQSSRFQQDLFLAGELAVRKKPEGGPLLSRT
jgi:hypothetical protein